MSGENAEKLSMLISSANRSKEILNTKIGRDYGAFTLFSTAYSVE